MHSCHPASLTPPLGLPSRLAHSCLPQVVLNVTAADVPCRRWLYSLLRSGFGRMTTFSGEPLRTLKSTTKQPAAKSLAPKKPLHWAGLVSGG